MWVGRQNICSSSTDATIDSEARTAARGSFIAWEKACAEVNRLEELKVGLAESLSLDAQ